MMLLRIRRNGRGVCRVLEGVCRQCRGYVVCVGGGVYQCMGRRYAVCGGGVQCVEGVFSVWRGCAVCGGGVQCVEGVCSVWRGCAVCGGGMQCVGGGMQRVCGGAGLVHFEAWPLANTWLNMSDIGRLVSATSQLQQQLQETVRRLEQHGKHR